jgi:hypothetical protein
VCLTSDFGGRNEGRKYERLRCLYGIRITLTLLNRPTDPNLELESESQSSSLVAIVARLTDSMAKNLKVQSA